MTEFQQKVLEEIDNGLAISEISKKLQCAQSSVSSVLKRFNIVPKKSLRKDNSNLKHDFFDNIDTEEKAYFLGFLIADGNISNGNHRSLGRISLNIQEEDGYILDKLKISINSDNSLKKKTYSKGAINRKPQCSFRWTSKQMVKSLNELNVHPNKTKETNFTLSFEKIPKEMWRHVIRGFIDGDGSFESHEYVFTPTIVGTSLPWLKQVANIVKEYTELDYTVKEVNGKTINYYYLRWHSKGINKYSKILKLYEFLYKDSTIYLDRKKIKIESYLKYRANQIN